MRQEQERIKEGYEQRAGNSGDSKLVKQLEKDLQDTKNYYNKRIREIEEKAKYGKLKNGKVTDRDEPKTGRSNQSDSELQKELKAERAKVEQLTKERNLFA